MVRCRIKAILIAAMLLFVAWRIGVHEHTNPYLRDDPGSPIPIVLGVLGAYLLLLGAIDSAERIGLRASRAVHAARFGAGLVLVVTAIVLVVGKAPPQAGLWLVFGGPLGYILGWVLGFICPFGRKIRAKGAGEG